MLSKFKSVRDEELVSKYKESRDDDIEMELVERYRIHSKKLAGELFQNYKYVFQVEFDDLYSIALTNLFVAIRSFKHNASFFRLWKTIAINEIKLYVAKLPLLKIEGPISIVGSSRDNDFVLSSSYNNQSDIDLTNEVEQIIIKNKDSFEPKDKDIFILFVAGYSIMDIAKETGLKYHYVRSRILIIKDRLGKYFA